jgi:hypothetical protein
MKPPTLQEVRSQLQITAYSQLGESAHWAVEQGRAIVPHLTALLTRVAEDKKKAEADGLPLAGYPLNLIWALGQIGGPEARAALARHAARAQDPDNRKLAKLALAGLDLRAKLKRNDVGVLRYETAPLLIKPSQESQKRNVLQAGQGFRVLKSDIINDKETDARGGSVHFDEIELIPGRLRGFLEREGEGFSPWF